ncbi:hypothetical protein PSCICN_43600 [Pseudomonas cichorii]|uniref:DUF6430 domain-containing protein n=1 Tax=Pseudomonas serbiensis TaxID=3064350 RepID=A0ABT9CYT9_9PSED|nr:MULTISPECIES: macro domain-containing protein [Pseudomonas]MDO7930063.1 DUF6430 domain-containing protein [Pseudomonas sp. KFB-138]GFM83668.1 hypothetical protein PSCICN_43600 [Pseudomonas cichorii]
MKKITIYDKRLIKKFLIQASFISAFFTLALAFMSIPDDFKKPSGYSFLALLTIIYIFNWVELNSLKSISLKIEGSTVNIKTGDLFLQPGFKAIAFNEYFDTIVDDKIISHASLNGIFITQHSKTSLEALDKHIESYDYDNDDLLEDAQNRISGKKQKYELGTICVYNDFLLAAFSRFDEKNKAYLTMPDYLGFLIKFWDKVNKIYAQKSVSVPIFGSGITRIKEHRNISDEELLKIMLWTFRISEMRFKHPAKLSIIIHKDKINEINLLDILSTKHGL